MSTNPYVEKLAAEINDMIDPEINNVDTSSGVATSSPGKDIAEFFISQYFEPKNKQIHDLHARVALLQASVDSLGKVLARHNAGACKEGESPIDCAKRLLSPVRDDTPARDRP